MRGSLVSLQSTSATSWCMAFASPEATLDLVLPSGALGELDRRRLMHHGIIPRPPGTRHVERFLSVSMRGVSVNHLAPGTLAFSRAKADLQGRVMRELHRLNPPLPRPIPSVGPNGKLKRNGEPSWPIWLHARTTFDKAANRDLDNFAALLKAVPDALVGPRWKGRPVKGQPRTPANRELIYQGALYKGGYLLDDSPNHVLCWFDFDPKLGEPRLTLAIEWDEPLD